MGRTSNAKQQLLDSAIALVHARSYAEVGVQELCEQAGVKKGSFYHFFPSKQDLMLTALEQQWEQARDDMLERAFAKDVTPLKRIERYFDAVYEIQRAVKKATGHVLGCRFGNLVCEMGAQDEAIRQKLAHILRSAGDYIEGALQDAVAAGELANINTKTSAQAILAYTQGLTLLAKAHNKPELIKQLGKTAVHLVIADDA